MIWNHLQKGCFVIQDLWWVFYKLDDVTKRARVTTAESLLKNLRSAQHQDWRYFFMGDESRFFSATDSERMWLPEGSIPHSGPRTRTSTPTVMVSIFWPSLGSLWSLRFRHEPNLPPPISVATSFRVASKECHLTWQIHTDN
jgi:hypothetical protein